MRRKNFFEHFWTDTFIEEGDQEKTGAGHQTFRFSWSSFAQREQSTPETKAEAE